MAKTPKIRFKNFSDEWVENKAFNIFKTTTEKGYSNLPVLSASQEFGMIKRDEIGINISYDEKSKKEYKRVKPGQFVIHLRSFQGGFAHSNIEGITSPAYTILDFQDTTKQYDFYWKYVLNSEKFIKQLESVTYGIRDGRSISYDEFLTLGFNYPNKKEQQKIGAFFSKLDKLIALHQSKFEKLQKIKKSCLQNLFPQNNQNTPKIRFKNFTDEWNSEILEKFCNIYDGTHQTPNYTNKGVMFLSVEDIKTLKSNKFISKIEFEKNYKIFPTYGDILLTRIGDIGVANVFLSFEKVAYYVSLALLKPKNVNSFFLQNSFSSDYLKNELFKRTLHIAFPKKINKNEIGKMQFKIPKNITEQEKIGAFFSKLNKLISLHQSKFEKLQKIKKSCLQNMFV